MTQTQAADRQAGPRRPLRLEPPGTVRLTGRGAVAALFAACLFGLLIASWTGWSALGNAFFVMSCGLVAFYTRPSGLRSVIVCPPLAFFTAAVCVEVITAPDTFSAAAGLLVTLATSAPWLFTGTALVIAIAFARGYRPRRPAITETPVVANLIEAARDARPSWSGRVRRRLRRRLPGKQAA
jgi:hypothetical protein